MYKNSKILIDIISAGLECDVNKVELAALTLSRKIKKDDPETASQISECISAFSLRTGSAIRSNSKPLPVDSDTHLEMATVIPPEAEPKMPILNHDTNKQMTRFLDERTQMATLLSKDIKPSNSLLLIGQPGTGKTMIAKYIASYLNKDLVVLDLSSSISSLLGKTGANLKKVLNYARNSGSVLLLDEFDAIAKRRDDNTDLGEIKRVVNVLLMELENWPVSSILLATSNHPELLDKAVWRRFDHTINVNPPGTEQRLQLLEKEFGEFYNDKAKKIIELAVEVLNGKSAADICKYCNNVKRRMVLNLEDISQAALPELSIYATDSKSKGQLCIATKERFGSISVRELADMLDMSPSGVQHHLSKLKPKSKTKLL
ncbi:ATP-binding protein [Mucilaginibacter puniceus]